MTVHNLSSEQQRKLREGEQGEVPSRSPRVFKSGTDWYFKTREGAVVGPYSSETAAAKGLTNFIEFLNLAPESTRAHLERALSVNTGSRSY